MNTILIVDDEKNILKMLSQGLSIKGYKTLTAASGEKAIQMCASQDVDLVLLDIMMENGIDGVETLIKLLEQQPNLSVVMMSAQQDIEIALKTLELGAKRYVTKPVSMDKILSNIEPFLELSRLAKENEILKSQIADEDEMVGESPAISKLRAEIRQVAASNLGVLISGENGTGKQLVANAIHRYSKRSDKPFIPLNCAALPEELVESELFGHERGAFTGADSMRQGRFELADGGTLFLDEIGDMTLKAQAKVLRVLEYGEVERLGSQQIRNVDVRIIAATNKDLPEEIELGQFRTDLYYRLKIVPIEVPPLRERLDDLPLLVKYFAERLQKNMASTPKTFASEAYPVFQSYHWPGNIRELKNIVERLLIMVNREIILPTDVIEILPLERDQAQTLDTAAAYQPNTPLSKMVDSAEAECIFAALKENDWNIKKTAEVLEVERSNLYKKMNKYEITRPEAS
ncbi:sigma-54-dependent Fis family transcriptional regulator [Candidatus Poribacteria bacterium]|nr:sigma-54-dependent Fis family transcriptional regulator [Candidatus Poribacteria bacterium]